MLCYVMFARVQRRLRTARPRGARAEAGLARDELWAVGARSPLWAVGGGGGARRVAQGPPPPPRPLPLGSPGARCARAAAWRAACAAPRRRCPGEARRRWAAARCRCPGRSGAASGPARRPSVGAAAGGLATLVLGPQASAHLHKVHLGRRARVGAVDEQADAQPAGDVVRPALGARHATAHRPRRALALAQPRVASRSDGHGRHHGVVDGEQAVERIGSQVINLPLDELKHLLRAPSAHRLGGKGSSGRQSQPDVDRILAADRSDAEERVVLVDESGERRLVVSFLLCLQAIGHLA